jgi:hypothetical protein
LVFHTSIDLEGFFIGVHIYFLEVLLAFVDLNFLHFDSFPLFLGLGLDLVVGWLFKFVQLLLKLIYNDGEHFSVLSLRPLEILGQAVVMVRYEASEQGFNFIGTFDPFLDIVKDLCSLDIEMTFDNSLEALSRGLELRKHSILNITVSHNIHVPFVLLLTIGCSSFLFESRFVEVDLL